MNVREREWKQDVAVERRVKRWGNMKYVRDLRKNGENICGLVFMTMIVWGYFRFK